MGGLDLPDLRTEIGIAQLRIMRTAIFKKTEVGKLILLNIKYSQIEADIRDHILERPDIDISYLTSTWVSHVCASISIPAQFDNNTYRLPPNQLSEKSRQVHHATRGTTTLFQRRRFFS